MRRLCTILFLALPLPVLADGLNDDNDYPAHDSYEHGEYDKDNYPQELPLRPLDLAPQMIELRLGAKSDALAATPQDHLRLLFEVLWSPMNHLQFGFEADYRLLPSDEMAIEEVGFFGEYLIARPLAISVGAFMELPNFDNGLDPAVWGLRVGVPMKFGMGSHFALVVHPHWQMHLNDDEEHEVAAIGGLQIGIVKQLALYALSGVEMTDYETDNAHLAFPFFGGVVISPARVFDIGVEFSMTDVSESTGRDDRWLMAWIAMRR